ncbi:MAG: thymidine phosphorylase, partial [Spirochaetaceae bacterium]|nr:thymidine phosphorylase [Spirochaetaceae bacterium]
MRVVDIIMKKRSGGELSDEELGFIIDGYVKGDIPEYQISALLMAIFFKSMTARETASLTGHMLRSGDVMDLSGIPGPFVDKHSTGGVGDKISLPLAPIVAACGAKVPMMSGRALGHTGGTLDKLESIPGYCATLEPAQFRAGIQQDGFAMTGQTARIVPADKKLYALRDVTATVESIPLITASILSKKVAEGADSLVFDVKCGPGAFMKTLPDAEALAKSLVGTGSAMGKKIIAVITDMSEPLGRTVGNFFEVEESLDCLEGHGPADVMELTIRLGAWMLVASGIAASVEQGEELC